MSKKIQRKLFFFLKIFFIVLFLSVVSYNLFNYYKKISSKINLLEANKTNLEKTLKDISSEISDLRNQDQYKINKDLESKVKSIETTYDKAVKAYENLLDLKAKTKNTAKDGTPASMLF